MRIITKEQRGDIIKAISDQTGLSVEVVDAELDNPMTTDDVERLAEISPRKTDDYKRLAASIKRIICT